MLRSEIQVKDKKGDCIEGNVRLTILLKECRDVLRRIFNRYENENIDELLDEINCQFFLDKIEEKIEEHICECGWFGTNEDLDESKTCPRCDEDIENR